ncbi:zinc finger CCHC domain-containing protein 7 [Xenentodon cancila]
MYSAYQDREKLEDDLYREDEGDSEGSEVNSELEFHLYSQLHYSSNAGDMEELEDEEEQEPGRKGQDALQDKVLEKTTDGDSEVEYTKDGKSPSPVNDILRQHRKKKVEKRKSEPKAQKLLPSLFEEVIVIDSSPDVISISEDDDGGDNDDDDGDGDGICTSKGRSLKRPQTSSLAQQGTRQRERYLGEPVTVVSSSSDSDSEESESESDSDSSDLDGLENWMILGQGNQDGDQTISLNLEGGSDNNTDADEEEGGSWLVSDKDKQAQIYNKDRAPRITAHPGSNRYYSRKNVNCKNCNKSGHLSKNCPDPKKVLPCFLCGTAGHVVTDCPNKHCNNCGQPGHVFTSCSEKAYWNKQCHRCRMTGHFLDACPEIWRQYHVTTKSGPPVKQCGGKEAQPPAYCYNCSRKGHFGHTCSQQRMFKGVYPVTQFINHYDTVKEINRRHNRIMMKAEEMKRNGYFTALSETPVTSEPPKKKQKISHHKGNHQNKCVPQLTRNNKAIASHIFFDDKCELRNATRKTKKFKRQEIVGNVKPWKPKRPVPISRDSIPPAKRVVDEADDFPRGGGPEENAEKKKRKKNKKKQRNEMSLLLPEGHKEKGPDHLRERRWELASKKQKGDKKKNGKNRAHKKLVTQMYPADENLFIIKQRKCSR